jgi:flagellar hook assembly protein FlgD
VALILQERSKAEEYAVKAGDTLEKIAAEKCPDLGWKVLARYNWGTSEPKEVRRAICELVGAKVADLAKAGLAGNPELIALAPDADLAPKLKIPKVWKSDRLPVEKTHTVTVTPTRPANAVEIMELDKWFIPEAEKCEVLYELHGDGDRADKLHFEVFGSNYCDATKWTDGLGTWSEPADLIDVPIFTKHLTSPVPERATESLPDEGWKGEATTRQGMLGRKTGNAKKRYINVAFSPYTAHFRYYKARGDEKARIVLEPFWPHWEAKEEEVPVTATPGGSIKLAWTNAEKIDYGAIEVRDAIKQRVWHKVIPDEKLKKGAQEIDWDKKYSDGAYNGKFLHEWIDDAATPTPLTELLFKSTPYTYKAFTAKYKKKDDSLKIKWEVRHTSKLEEGVIEITDGTGKIVLLKPLGKAKLGQGKHEFAWDGKYPEGVKNSEDGEEIIPKDMPYRVQIRAHTKMNTPEALALAAMHTEVRLYVHKSAYRPKDARFHAPEAEPCLRISRGPLVPGDPPKKGSGTEWYRYELAKNGFHPGPVKAGAAAQREYEIAMVEFKRSVPANCAAAPPNFTRQVMSSDTDAAENGPTEAALAAITAQYRRSVFGDPDKIASNDDDPGLTDDEVDERLHDRGKKLVVWVDDRQYYTESNAKDENNDRFTAGTPARSSFGLWDYRRGMENADGKVDTDAAHIARPWIPLKAELSLLGREDPLYPDYSAAKVKLDDPELRARMSRAIGPLPVHWTVDELPMDVSVINPTASEKARSRPRKYAAWAIHENKAEHTRKDTGRIHLYTNCTETQGGIRPPGPDPAGYYENAFGIDALGLDPWKAKKFEKSQSIATIVHDHISDDQKDKYDAENEDEKQTLFEELVGAAGVYFRPSLIAGDGYRVRAEVKFKESDGYKFKNLEALRRRYPVRPHAQSAEMRVWRRSSIRGYMCWGAEPAGHWPGFIGTFRNLYKTAHVYFVHERGGPQKFQVASVFDPANNAHKDRYKNIVKNNDLGYAELEDVTKMRLRSADIWPWGHRDDLGWPWVSPEGLTSGDLYDQWLDPDVIENTWRKFREGLLIALVKEVEKRGLLRGHLFVEFESSPGAFLEKHECDDPAKHTYYAIEKDGAASPVDGVGCPGAGGSCPGTLRAAGTGKPYNDGLPLPAVGVALGATWLFTSSDAETWAHEVGHHRHLEHSASAPGAAASLHDSENNSTQNWAGLGVTDADEQNWDSMCIMSYASAPDLCFCGRCVLRNRGWRVEALGFPGPSVKEP